MKELKKISLHTLSWLIVPLILYFFKWAAQDSTALPGLPAPQTESFFEIMKSNFDVIIVSLLGSIPIFYCSEYFLAPKLFFKASVFKFFLFLSLLISHYFIVRLVSEFIFPMYYFFGDPYAIKVLGPIILLSAITGTLFAYREKLNN